MTPVANFLISPNFLTVQFTDISTNTPTSWSWDFGDLSPLDITQNPSHLYATAGTYIVKLTATNIDGFGTIQRTLVVSTVPILPVPLKTFLNCKLPSTIIFDEDCKDAYIAQWQLFIQPLVSPIVVINDVFKESAYPPLANALIAMLAAYSVILDAGTKGITTGAAAGTSSGATPVKKIVTGPSEVEFQDVANAQQDFFAKEGVIAKLREEICSMSNRLLIKLPMCPPLPDVKLLNLKAGRINTSIWNKFPYLIPITI